MKTLLERLKDEHVITLHNKGEEFPHTTDAVFDALKENTRWTDLTYEIICILNNDLELSDYSPSTISNLFND